MRSPRGVRLTVAILAIALVGQLGCGGEDCDCAAGPSVYVRLAEGIPADATVEVCFEDTCAPMEVDATYRANGAVFGGDLGGWPDRKDGDLTVTVRDGGGEELRQVTGVADREDGGCCGDYWTLRA